MALSIVKTNAWISDTNAPRPRNSTGITRLVISVNTSMTVWSADMFAANPFMKMFSDMMKPAEEKKPEPEPKPEPPKESAAGADLKQYSDMMSAMFDSGLEVGKAYQKSIESILDGYMKNGGDAADKS